MNLTSDFCKGDIVVHYYDSRRFLFVQMADLIANTFFRKYQNKRDGNDNVALCSGIRGRGLAEAESMVFWLDLTIPVLLIIIKPSR